MKDIYCIGHITRDHVVTPTTDVFMAGGTAFYTSYALHALPHEVSFGVLTKVGKDNDAVVRKMTHDGISVKAFPCAHSTFFENRYETDQNNRHQRLLAAADPFTIEEVSQAEARVFHLGSLLSTDFPPEVVERLAQRGKIYIDVQGYLRRVDGEQVLETEWQDKRRVLRCTSILQMNEHEMASLTGLHDARSVAREVHGWGVPEVVITLGSEGSMVYDGTAFYDIPAYKPQRVVDATGCGDTYSAGYLWARTRGAGCMEAGKLAAAMCTSKLEHNGPYKGGPSPALQAPPRPSPVGRENGREFQERRKGNSRE